MHIQSYERITARIVALLEQGTVPWHRPWKVQTGPPRNFLSNKLYRGVNVFLLLSLGYESPFWLTFRQARELGGRIKKGEKACPVVFWKQIKIEDEDMGKDRRIPLLRLYQVFNVAQCEGLKNSSVGEAPFVGTKPAEIVANMPGRPHIKHGMAEAFYRPSDDVVGMPERERFESEAKYFGTLFHELIHATGSAKRLNRKTVTAQNSFGSDPYSKEELIAELGGAFLCGHAELVDLTIDSSAAYIENWLKQLKDDRTLIVHAAAQAQKAADFVLGRTSEEGGNV